MSAIAEHAGVISLLIFFSVFVIAAFKAYRPSMRETMKSHAMIPLKEDE